MQVKFIKSGVGGHTVIEFVSEDTVHQMGTFYRQIPPQIHALGPEETFEIPDDFMRTELGISEDENPLEWYEIGSTAAWAIEDKHEQAEAVNTIFRKFMDAVGRFCEYDRKAAMDDQQRWSDEMFPQL